MQRDVRTKRGRAHAEGRAHAGDVHLVYIDELRPVGQGPARQVQDGRTPVPPCARALSLFSLSLSLFLSIYLTLSL